jgi:hypothetical protein
MAAKAKKGEEEEEDSEDGAPVDMGSEEEDPEVEAFAAQIMEKEMKKMNKQHDQLSEEDDEAIDMLEGDDEEGEDEEEGEDGEDFFEGEDDL